MAMLRVRIEHPLLLPLTAFAYLNLDLYFIIRLFSWLFRVVLSPLERNRGPSLSPRIGIFTAHRLPTCSILSILTRTCLPGDRCRFNYQPSIECGSLSIELWDGNREKSISSSSSTHSARELNARSVKLSSCGLSYFDRYHFTFLSPFYWTRKALWS